MTEPPPPPPQPALIRCQKCGYDLTRVAPGGVCPECGVPVVVKVDLSTGPDLAVLAWLGVVAALALEAIAFVLVLSDGGEEAFLAGIVFAGLGMGAGGLANVAAKRALVRVQAGRAPLASARFAFYAERAWNGIFVLVVLAALIWLARVAIALL